MIISSEVKEIIESATSKALATSGPAGLNIVPVSMVRVVDNRVWLFNFFMGKTVQNLTTNHEVALACWDGLSGVQLRATVQYTTGGDLFDEAVEWVAGENPDRVVRGLLVLTSTAVYDVTADKTRAGVLLQGI